MKTLKATACLLLAIGGVPLTLAAQQPFHISPQGYVDPDDLLKATQRPATRERITDAELGRIKQKHKLDYGPAFTPTAEPQSRPDGDYYADSIILTDGKDHTVLPHSSIITIPTPYQLTVVQKPVGELVFWPKFLKQNWQWIRLHEVTVANANGEDPIPDSLIEQLAKGGRLVVGVHRQNPISVLRPPPTQPSPGDGQ